MSQGKPPPFRGVVVGALLVVALYGTSFLLRAFQLIRESVPGWRAFEVVIRLPFREDVHLDGEGMSWLVPLWLANPLFLLGLFYYLRRFWLGATVMGTAACLCALRAMFLDGWRFEFSWLREGYFCWLGSMALLSVLAFVQWRMSRSAQSLSAG